MNNKTTSNNTENGAVHTGSSVAKPKGDIIDKIKKLRLHCKKEKILEHYYSKGEDPPSILLDVLFAQDYSSKKYAN